MSEPPISHITVNNIDTAYLTAGEGVPVILLHGWAASAKLMWPLAEKLARDFAIYAPDLPGFGNTALPPNPWTVFDYANFVLAFMDAVQVERAHLIGHSFGGRLSLILGADHAHRFDKIVLIDSAGVRPKVPWYRSLPATLFHAVEGALPANGPVGEAINTLREKYRARVGSEDYQNAGPLRETFLNVISEDLLPYAARVRRPSLLLWGANDDATPVSQGTLLEQTIPDAGLVVFAGAGHYSYLDALPDAVRVIDYFFKNG